MSIKRNGFIPEDNHVIRYIPWSKLRKDENNKVIGILGEAFKPRPSDKEGLSAAWVEYSQNDSHQNKIEETIKILRNSELVVKPKSGFAIGKVLDIKSSCRKIKNIEVNAIYKPSPKNEAHVEVRRLPQDDSELHELLAEEAWAELILNESIPCD